MTYLARRNADVLLRDGREHLQRLAQGEAQADVALSYAVSQATAGVNTGSARVSQSGSKEASAATFPFPT